MISIIMPYWRRRELLINSIKAYEEFYSSNDLEIIIIDDGSWDIGEISSPLNIKIYPLPFKEIPMNPCVPLNEGVRRANSDIIVLTTPEILHLKPIFQTMQNELEILGNKGYVSAAVWDVDRLKWFAHTSIVNYKGLRHGKDRVPANSSFHFCVMMYKEFFNEIGGYSEEYRNGQAYDDTDLLWKLEEAGCKFKTLDKCVVHHFNTKTNWPAGGHSLNKSIYQKKWKHKI